MDRALLDVIDEGNVVARVPIQRVEHRVEVHRIQELVYRVNHLLGGEKKTQTVKSVPLGSKLFLHCYWC